MAALTASPHDALPPSWDETIVPSLRKRLESESRILTKRLSTISITEDGTPQEPPQNASRAVSPPRSHGEQANGSGSYTHRPSAIPRPSFSRNGERVVSPSSSQATDSAGKSVPKRKRTRSTPFPFETGPSSPPMPNGDMANGTRSPSSSGSVSPGAQSPSLGRTTPTPSRIPTVYSRMRSGSQSNQALGTHNAIGKSSLPPAHKFSASEATSVEYETRSHNLHMNGSSSSITRQRIIDEKPPFTNDPSPRGLEREFTGRPSSDEERPFQHWYRGDVSRNGGVGEYRVGKRMEMLDIANYGHALREPRSGTRPYEEPTPRSERIDFIPRKRAESVSSRERASIYIDPQDETVTGRVLDEMPLTDVEAEEIESEHNHYHRPYDSPAEFGVQQERFQGLSAGVVPPVATSSSATSNRVATSKSQTRIPQAQSRSNNSKQSMLTPTTTTSEPSSPGKSRQSDRGRAHASATSNAKGPPKAKAQKRSKSAAEALRTTTNHRDSSEYSGLVDAVPDTRSPLPRDANWDEVILPTVARRMGIKYETEELAVTAKVARESCIAPAPGTFGYDYTKYKPPRPGEEIPMGEFGQRAAPPQQDQSRPEPDSTAEKPLEGPGLRYRRDTLPSPAPFSHYGNESDEASVRGARRQADRSTGHRKGQDVPQILVSPPTMDAEDDKPAHAEDEPDAGCCKCVIM